MTEKERNIIPFMNWKRRIATLTLKFALFFFLMFAIDYFILNQTKIEILNLSSLAFAAAILIQVFFIDFNTIEFHPKKLILTRMFWRNVEIDKEQVLSVTPSKGMFGKQPLFVVLTYFKGRVKNIKLPIPRTFNTEVLIEYAQKKPN